MPYKSCPKCNESKPEDEFPWRDRKKGYRRSYCRPCENKRSNERKKRKFGSANNPKSVKKQGARIKSLRASGAETERFIRTDSRRSDKKHGRENDLTKEFIAEQIAKGCSYCGETELRMTLDRIDNNIGHTQANTVPACIRCNYARRSMPYEAWLCLKPGLRQAREQGLFGDWTGRCR